MGNPASTTASADGPARSLVAGARPAKGIQRNERLARWTVPAVAAHAALALTLGALGGAVLAPAGEDAAPLTMAFAPAADAVGAGAEAGGASTDAASDHGQGAASAEANQPALAEPDDASRPLAAPAEAPPPRTAAGEPAADAATTSLAQAAEATARADEAAERDATAGMAVPEQMAGIADRPLTPVQAAEEAAPVQGPLPVPPRPPSRTSARPAAAAPPHRTAPAKVAAAARQAATAPASGPSGSAGPGDSGAGTGGGAPSAGGAPDGAWVSGVVLWLRAHRTYPIEARQRGEQGSAVVRLTVARDGRVRTFTLVQSTGSARLDAAVEALLSHAELPPFPPSMAHEQATIQIPIRYQLAS